MKVESCSEDGRTLYVEYKCSRCGKTHYEPLAVQIKAREGYLRSFIPPEGWTSACPYTHLLCDDCANIYRSFMEEFLKHEINI